MPPTTVIEGRTVNQRTQYAVRVSPKRHEGFHEKRLCWVPVRSIRKLDERVDVFNLEVEEDNSYVADSLIVHNCQDLSNAGKRAGLGGSRSGLFFEFARIVGEVRPRYVLIENVSALVNRGLSVVLGTLAELGYDAEWDVLGADDFGAPHRRKRLFVIGHRRDVSDADGDGVRLESERGERGRRGVRAAVGRDAEPSHDGSNGSVVDVDGDGCSGRTVDGRATREVTMADADGDGRSGIGQAHDEPRGSHALRDDPDGRDSGLADADGERSSERSCFGGVAREELEAFVRGGSPWRILEPDVGGEAARSSSGMDGVEPGAGGGEEALEGTRRKERGIAPWEYGVDGRLIPRTVERTGRGTQRHEDKLRLGAIGNGVVPCIAEFIGRRLAEIDRPLDRQTIEVLKTEVPKSRPTAEPMLVMVSNQSGVQVGRMAGRYPGRLGHLYSPSGERGPWDFLPYALDNGAYGAFANKTPWDEAKWRKMLDWAKRSGQDPLWCIVPDVVCDKDGTLAYWKTYAPVVRAYGWRPAIAVQDGMTFDDVPDDECVVFLGGSTGWKDAAIAPWCARFPGRVHVGRVNHWKRLMHSHVSGASSVDGTGWFHKVQRALLVKYLEEQP